MLTLYRVLDRLCAVFMSYLFIYISIQLSRFSIEGGGRMMNRRISLLAVAVLAMSLFLFPNLANAERQSIGRWIDNDPYAGSTIEIFKENRKFYMRKKYKDGSGGIEEVFQIRKSVYQIKNPVNGDHYVINSMNQLEIRDNAGLITIAYPSN